MSHQLSLRFLFTLTISENSKKLKIRVTYHKENKLIILLTSFEASYLSRQKTKLIFNFYFFGQDFLSGGAVFY